MCFGPVRFGPMRVGPMLALLSLSLPAAAATQHKFDLQVSSDAGNSWSDLAQVTDGQVVLVRAAFLFGRDTFSQFGGMEITQIDVAGSDVGDAAYAFGGRFVPKTQTFALLGAGNPGASIDRTDAPGNIIFGNPSGNGGVRDNPIILGAFSYHVSNVRGRSITLDVPISNFVSGYGLNGSTQIPFSASDITFDGAVIQFVPSPGTLVPVAGIGLLTRRRRTREIHPTPVFVSLIPRPF